MRVRRAAATFLAAVASVLALVMPLVLKGIADGPVAHHDPAGVWRGGALPLMLGVAEAGILGVRRPLAARPLAGIEAGMRRAFYRHVQRLPVAALERWSSGPATVPGRRRTCSCCTGSSPWRCRFRWSTR